MLGLTRTAESSPRGQTKVLCPTAQLLALTLEMGHPEIYSRWQQQPSISTFKAKSRRRLDQLNACARLLATATALFPESPEALVAWQAQLVEFRGVTGWDFYSIARCTPLQQSIHELGSSPNTGAGEHPFTPFKEDPHGPRAPPGGLL